MSEPMTDKGQAGTGRTDRPSGSQTGNTAAAGEARRQGPHWTSQWRARYRRGDWLVLSGPTSLVVMQPAAPQWSDLVNAIWEDVVASASIQDLAARLAEFKLDAMPDFAAVFWDTDEIRSLVRGQVSLVDPQTGEPIAHGEGIRTWSEIGLGDRQQIEVHAGEQSEDEELELPLVIGAAGASRILLDASEPMQIRSPQGTFAGDADALNLLPAPEPEWSPEPEPAAEPGRTGEEPARAAEPGRADEPEPTVALANEPTVAVQNEPTVAVQSEPTVALPDRAAMENAETLVGQPPVPPNDDSGQTVLSSSLPGMPVPAPTPRPVVGVLRVSSGGQVEVDRPVVIGRSPSASRVSGDQLPRLLTVPSPSHDISRTHVQVAPENGRMVITDLDSTNGTILVGPDGRRTDLRPGVGVPVEFGSLIDLGDGITITVDRS